MTAGLAGNVCLWTAAPEKRQRNKKMRTGCIRGWGYTQLLLTRVHRDEGPGSQWRGD